MSAIREEHWAFAQELAALCRKHGVSSFNAHSGVYFRLADAPGEGVDVFWSEGRHGVAGTILLRVKAEESRQEQRASAAAEGDAA